MAARALLLSAALLCCSLATTASALKLNVDHYAGAEAARLGHAQTKADVRRGLLEAEEGGDVCDEGCFDPPSNLADPYPLLLVSTTDGTPISLLECYQAALDYTAANITYFAIIDETSCFGGFAMPAGWGQNDDVSVCPKLCFPGLPEAGPCGSQNVAAVFSMGKCEYPGVPCSPDSPPPASPSVSPSPSDSPAPSPGGSPSASPSPSLGVPRNPPASPDFAPPPEDVDYPSPPPATKAYECRDSKALWGTFLPDTPIKLNPTRTSEENTEACKALCDAEPACTGFYYKTTTWCYLMERTYAFSNKQYSTAFQACKVVPEVPEA